MTAEHIHDALTLLPADLIAEADKKRCQTPRVIPWSRYAAMAACFALVLCSSWFCMKLFAPKGATEALKVAQEEAAPMERAANSFQGADTAAEMEAAEEPAAPAAPASGESTAQDTAGNPTAQLEESGILSEGISRIRYVEAMPGASTSACFAGNPGPELFRSPADLEAYRDKPIQRFDPGHLLENCADYDEGWFEDHDLLLLSLCSVPIGEPPQITEIRHYESQWKFLVEDYSKRTEAERQDWHILIETEKNLVGSEEALVLTTVLSGSEIPTQRIDTSKPDSDASYAGAPDELLVCSRAELDAYFLQYAHCYDFAVMREVCGDYDESWFETHDLLLIAIQAAHPDTPWEIVDITKGSRWDWEVLVSHRGVFYPDEENNSVHLLAEVDKGTILPGDNIIRVTEVPPGT